MKIYEWLISTRRDAQHNLVIREIQIKMIIKKQLTAKRIVKIPKTGYSKHWGGCGCSVAGNMQ